jgi:hypothetical protein
MSKLSKKIALILVFAVLVTMGLAGCGSGKASDATTAAVQQSNTTGAATTQAATTQAEERIKLKMFMGNSGLPYPAGVDASNNDFIKIVEDYANVDLELEVPNYEDFQTKFQLLLSSNNLPDIVHTYYTADAYKAADQGAFIDLKSYYDKSTAIQKYITSTMMEDAKSASGHYYRIPMAWDKSPDGFGNWTRKDMIDKYNGGKMPETVDEWVAYLKVIKKTFPNSTPLTARGGGLNAFSFGYTFFKWYGAMPYYYRVTNGKVVSTFTLPEYKACVELFKQLYKEGILDKEFITNDYDKFSAKVQNNQVVLFSNTADQLGDQQDRFSKLKGSEESIWVCTPPLKSYPSVVSDTKYVDCYSNMPISAHGLYITSKCKEPDRAWRVIEGFASDDLFQAIFWGKEGQEYTVKDGKKVMNMEKFNDTSRSWSLQLALIFGFAANSAANQDNYAQTWGTDKAKTVFDSLQYPAAEGKNRGVMFRTFVPTDTPGLDKYAESESYISEATAQAVMGHITMEQFDKKVQDYQKKYGIIWDTYTKYMNEHKDDLLSKNCLEVNW